MPYIVELKSEEYGTEIFEYDSLEEAQQGYERLQKQIARAYREDGIERYLSSPVFIEEMEEEVY